MLPRTTFKQPARPERQPRAWPGVQTFAPTADMRIPITAQPKTTAKRNPHLLTMARGQPCLLMVPPCFSHRTDTTVAAHSNWAIHGKAKGRKADDCYVIYSCVACHSWLDTGSATKAQKQAAFMAGHFRQVLVWRQIAGDATAPAKDRAAALWALEHLGAWPETTTFEGTP